MSSAAGDASMHPESGGPDLTASQLGRDDLVLVQRLRDGDAEAVAGLARRHGDELRLFCRRMLSDATQAEDVVQDVFTACCGLSAESLPTSSVRGWLYQLCRNRCIDALRRRRPAAGALAYERRGAQRSFESAVDPLTTPAGKALKRDRAERVLAALSGLDEELRAVVLMRYFQNLSREEISEAIGLGLAGTKARLSKAMEALRDALGGMGETHAGG
ncbi:MAG: sigma-70 family RNA polymerase sigma factor [Planctomycetia bacterium]|nr:MAG: sigma-70 family RNA polymerase sigma factor [Planctomycetia bacterium]